MVEVSIELAKCGYRWWDPKYSKKYHCRENPWPAKGLVLESDRAKTDVDYEGRALNAPPSFSRPDKSVKSEPFHISCPRLKTPATRPSDLLTS